MKCDSKKKVDVKEIKKATSIPAKQEAGGAFKRFLGKFKK